MYDLLVKGGEVIDVAQGIHGQSDIAISQGKIASVAQEIASSKAKRVIDAKGKIVTPGLFDIHTHSADGLINVAVEPDEDGVFSGVTTVCDGGSTGYANFPGFKKFVIPQAKTDILCFLGLHPVGLAVIPESWSWRDVNPEAILKTIEDNRDLVRGIKMRAVGGVAETLGIELIKTGKKIAVDAGVPVMVHIGKDPPEETPADVMESLTRQLLPLLDKGDILTHVFSPKRGQVIKPDGSMLPGFREAMERGIILDVASGSTNLSFEIARKALAEGILPDTLSTDVSTFYAPRRLILTRLMSKFLALGLSLDKVIEMTTINPARALGEEQRRGSLKVGMPADISILELTEGNFTFLDALKNTIKGNLLLVPSLTLKSGVEILPEFPSDMGSSVIF